MITQNYSLNTDSGKRFWLAAAVLTIFFCYSFAGVLYTLLRSWYSNAAYSHGFLVVLISGYLVWDCRKKLAAIPPSPNLYAGTPLLLTSLLLYLAGELGGILALQELSLIIAFAGIVLLTLGTEFLKKLLFPIVYMIFMLTSWDLLTERLHEPFQHISAVLGTELMQLVGVPAYRENIFIELPNITLEVARVCSGVNYLVAVAAIGIPLAYIALHSWKRRIILVVYGLVMAVIANGIRVALIGTLSYYNLSGDLHGPLHTLHAMFVAVVGYIFLFIGVWVLSDRKKWKEKEKAANRILEEHTGYRKQYLKTPYIVAIALLFLFGSIINFHTSVPTPLEQPLSATYSYVSQWNRLYAKDMKKPIILSGVDDELQRSFSKGDKSRVGLYIGYYEYQVQGKELVSSQLDRLYSGATKVKIPTASSSKGFIEVNHTIIETPEGSRLTYFWYEMNGKVITGRLLSKFYSSWHSLVYKRTAGALVIVTVDIAGYINSESAQRDAEEFIKETVGRL